MSTLLCIRGPLTGARLRLDEQDNYLGRSPDSTITLPDSTVSRTHALVRKQRMGWMLEDCGSASGTLLNGNPVRIPVPLSPNDEIRIGHSIFLFDSDFDLQNAVFTDNSVYLSAPYDETMVLPPVAVLEPTADAADSPARHGMELLTEIGDLFDSTRVPFGEAMRHTMERMGKMMRAHVALLMLYDQAARELRASAAVANGDVLADRSILMKVFKEQRAVLLSDKPELAGHPALSAPPNPKVRSVVAAPLLADQTCLGVAFFERQELDAYTLKDLRLVQSLGRLLAIFIETRQRAEALSLRLNYQVADSMVVGGSAHFKRVMDMVRRVAETPATVLLIGETGTGKEVIASELHRLSPQGRAGRPFITVNCAAIPETLFESQLFGHEKGSFTGAHRLHQGFIEQAQGGTLLLDEIGEMSMNVQPKLLRFLQEHTFSRVGGTRMLRAEVRIVAATNRDLNEEVRAGRFREDLFHRLNVMPIEIPPLRERREDIRALAEYYVQKFAKTLRKQVLGISEDALIMLEKYRWPGNIRELANCIERAVLLCDEKVLLPRNFIFDRGGPSSQGLVGVRLSKDEVDPPSASPGSLPTLADVERDHILRVMNNVGQNQVRAAEILGIHRNTLRKKLQDYGV